MRVQDRSATRAEMPLVVGLWEEVFGVERPFFQSLLDAEPRRLLSQTQVTECDGRIVSSVQVFVRHLRGLDGAPVRVGGIGSVSTDEAHQRRGHSSRLLRRSIEVMRGLGCAWSFLFTGIHRHYERFGWRRMPMRVRVGELAAASVPSPEYRVERLGSLEGAIPQLARVYDAFNADRPLSNVRTRRAWNTAVQYRMKPWKNEVWVARPRGRKRLAAYVLVRRDEGRTIVAEVGCTPGRSSAAGCLFAAVRETAAERGDREVALHLPGDPELEEAIPFLARRVGTETHDYGMALSLGPEMDWQMLDRLFHHPRAQHWPADDF